MTMLTQLAQTWKPALASRATNQTTKLPVPNRKRKQDDESLSSTKEKEVTNTEIFNALTKLTAMGKSFDSGVNENTLPIANLAKSLDFNNQEINDFEDKVKTLK